MKILRLALPALLAATPALAHTGHDAAGFTAGAVHPLFGLDHLLAMVAVGLWTALRGGRALPGWPAAFVGGMLGGFALARLGLVLPAHETMIAGTLVGLGGAIALGLSAPAWAGAALLAAFGLAHGFAHGLEVSGSVLAFAGGFALATAALHAAGIGLALAAAKLQSRLPLRLAGAGVLLAGVALASGVV